MMLPLNGTPQPVREGGGIGVDKTYVCLHGHTLHLMWYVVCCMRRETKDQVKESGNQV